MGMKIMLIAINTDKLNFMEQFFAVNSATIGKLPCALVESRMIILFGHLYLPSNIFQQQEQLKTGVWRVIGAKQQNNDRTQQKKEIVYKSDTDFMGEYSIGLKYMMQTNLHMEFQGCEFSDDSDNPLKHKLATRFLETSYSPSNPILQNDHDFHTFKKIKPLKIKQTHENIKNDSETEPDPCQPSFFRGTIPIIHANVFMHYSIISLLGEGSFGKVYHAKHLKQGKQVAVKAIKRSISQQETQIKILSQLYHENVLKLHEVYEYQNRISFVVDYCRGGSLLTLLKKAKSMNNHSKVFSQSNVKSIMRQVLEALQYLHSLMIVHGDIKLANIVFFDDISADMNIEKKKIKIIDFGLSRKNSFKVVKLDRINGTKAYMPPQTKKGWYSLKNDIWSCGIVIYGLISGAMPLRKMRRHSDIKSVIMQEKLSFSEPEWNSISQNAKKLIVEMLNPNFGLRPSASQCLKSDWFLQQEIAQ